MYNLMGLQPKKDKTPRNDPSKISDYYVAALESRNEINQLSEKISVLVSTAKELEAHNSSLESILSTGKGLGYEGALVSKASLEGIYTRLGIKPRTTSLESFRYTGTSLQSTQESLEDNKGILARVWQAIIDAFKWLGKKLKAAWDWVAKFFTGTTAKELDAVTKNIVDGANTRAEPTSGDVEVDVRGTKSQHVKDPKADPQAFLAQSHSPKLEFKPGDGSPVKQVKPDTVFVNDLFSKEPKLEDVLPVDEGGNYSVETLVKYFQGMEAALTSEYLTKETTKRILDFLDKVKKGQEPTLSGSGKNSTQNVETRLTASRLAVIERVDTDEVNLLIEKGLVDHCFKLSVRKTDEALMPGSKILTVEDSIVLSEDLSEFMTNASKVIDKSKDVITRSGDIVDKIDSMKKEIEAVTSEETKAILNAIRHYLAIINDNNKASMEVALLSARLASASKELLKKLETTFKAPKAE